MAAKSRVTILVKAFPRPSKTYGETVCCAGIDDTRKWRRLYPIRFRQLAGDQTFSRWDVVEYEFDLPISDLRRESCRVREDTLKRVGKVVQTREKQDIVASNLVGSEREAASRGASLALLRPTNVRLKFKRRSADAIEAIRTRYQSQARQTSFLDKELASIKPMPFDFFLTYSDHDGAHTKRCADWETEAAFSNFRKLYGEAKALELIRMKYCEEYVDKGLVLALGNLAKRPNTWQLLGLFPVEPAAQIALL